MIENFHDDMSIEVFYFQLVDAELFHYLRVHFTLESFTLLLFWVISYVQSPADTRQYHFTIVDLQLLTTTLRNFL